MSRERGPRAKSYSLSELGIAPKTTSERVAKLRADRDALGLKRLELYAHPEDWPAIKAIAEKLQRKRARVATEAKGKGT